VHWAQHVKGLSTGASTGPADVAPSTCVERKKERRKKNLKWIGLRL